MIRFVLFLIICTALPAVSPAQLYIAPGDSVSVLPGTVFTLQDDLVNEGRIFNGGTLTLNGTVLQTLAGAGGWIENLTAANSAQLVHDLTVQNLLQINPGFYLDLSGRQLNSGGQVLCNGWLRGSSGSALRLSGSGNSSLLMDPAVDGVSNALRLLQLEAGSAALQNKLYIHESFLPQGGNFSLNNELVLRSNAAGTARVGPVSSGISYGAGGRFVIERYIPGRRAWRLLTAPVTPGSNVTISDAWQDGAPRVTNVFDINSTNNPRPGFGTHVTFGLPATNGYDQGINGNPSIRYLTATGWHGVPTATNDGSTFNSGRITDQPGYMLFVRGDRSTPLWQATGAVTTPTVLRPAGRIRTGTQDMNLGPVFANGGGRFYVLGNPYPSALSFHAMITHPVNVAAGMPDAFYLWDPAITGTNGVGGFVGFSYNAAASILAGRPVYDRSVASALPDNGEIQSGAAFVVDYAGSATSLRTEESHKVSGSHLLSFRPLPARQLSVQLRTFNADSSISLQDGALVQFEAPGMQQLPVPGLRKLPNFSEELAVSTNGQAYCIARLASARTADTIALQLARLRPKKYRLQLHFSPGALPAHLAAFLYDAYLKTRHPLRLQDTGYYDFTPGTDPASFHARRFSIVFSEFSGLASFIAEQLAGQARLQWQLKDTAGLEYLILEREVNGRGYTQLGRLQPVTDTWIDPLAESGVYRYRLRGFSRWGNEFISEVRELIVQAGTGNYTVFPNPVNGHHIGLQILKIVRGQLSYRLLDYDGKLIQAGLLQKNPGMNPILMQRQLAAGFYRLQVLASGQEEAVLPLYVQPLR